MSLRIIRESEASSARVTPVQQRRRHVPNKHPHRRGRKVSAPPELQPHLGPHLHQPKKHPQGGAITDTTEPQGYIINIGSANNGNVTGNENIYSVSGSDSGVTSSEYSSWTAPATGQRKKQRLPFEDDLASANGSIEDLLDENSAKRTDKYYQSDSESETQSVGLNSPIMPHRQGVNNPAYVATEASPIVLSVDGPPPLNRSYTDTSLMGHPSSIPNTPHQSNHNHRQRTSSMVLQLNLNNAENIPHATTNVSTMPTGRSVSLVSLNQAGVNTLPNVGYPNLNNYNHDTQSIYSEIGNQYNTGYLGAHNITNTMGSQGSLSGIKNGTAHANDPDDPESTPDDEKKVWTIKKMAHNASLLYAIFLITLATVIYLADIFSGHDSAMAEFFNVFLILAQVFFLVWFHYDVRKYLSSITKAVQSAKDRVKEQFDPISVDQTPDGHYELRINLPEKRDTIPQSYGFTSGRHGGSLYLKIGALVFCIGHLIHSGLNLGQKIMYLTADDPMFEDCTCTPDVLMSVLQPAYAFYNLFFVFKFSNLIINRNKLIARFGLMHCIAASLCFWIYAIMQETLQAIYAKKAKAAGYYNVTTTTMSPRTLLKYDDDDDDDSDEMFDTMKKYKSMEKADTYGSAQWNINFGCEKSTPLTNMINYTTPYLYPFSIEYNILIVGVWILILENIGKIEHHTHIPSVEVTYEEDDTREFTSNMIIYVDCHASNRGLFAGLLLTVSTVISIILFFIFTSSEDSLHQGLFVKGISEFFILVIMTATVAAAYNAIRRLDVIKAHISAVDDILLIICIPCILLYAFLNMFPSLMKGNWFYVCVYCLQAVQAITQTIFIGDGLRRCANSSSLQQKKPGRELITFLVVANVALWMLETFEIKNDAGNADKYEFYGKNLWTLLSHMTLPLALFYRFHSSVCLADMWKIMYEQDSDH